MNDGLRQLANVDLNLLTVFRALDETRHVTRAAKALGLSQPALSHALARLRRLFDDSLFVRSPRGLVPTPRAEGLAPLVKELMALVEKGMGGGADFSPSKIDRTFRVKTTDMVESQLVPKLLGRLEAEAPQSRVAVTSVSFSLPKEGLETGACDLAIAGFFGELPAGLYHQKLFRDSFLCVVRKGHPRLRGKKVSLDEFCEERHLLIAPGGELSGPADVYLAKKKRHRRIVAGISTFAGSGWVVGQTDTVLTGPARLIRQMAPVFGLRLFEPPMELPNIEVVQVWHERNHSDPAHKWFREKVREVLQE